MIPSADMIHLKQCLICKITGVGMQTLVETTGGAWGLPSPAERGTQGIIVNLFLKMSLCSFEPYNYLTE